MIQFSPIPPGPLHDSFHASIRQQIEALNHDQLPLQQALQQTSVVSLEDPFQAIILHTDDSPESIVVKCGIFYAGVIGGCSCADDPTPTDTLQEYCEIELEIDRGSGKVLHLTLL